MAEQHLYCNSQGRAMVMTSHIRDSSARLRSSSRETLVSASMGAGSLAGIGAAGGSGGMPSSTMGSSESVLLESASPEGLAFAARPRPLPRPRPRPRVGGGSALVVVSGSEGGPAEDSWAVRYHSEAQTLKSLKLIVQQHNRTRLSVSLPVGMAALVGVFHSASIRGLEWGVHLSGFKSCNRPPWWLIAIIVMTHGFCLRPAAIR